jgi:hypothetical protein
MHVAFDMKLLSILSLLVLATATPALAARGATEIAVTGSASVAVVPDQATVNASITTIDPNAGTATARNNAIYNTIVDALAQRGIARDDVTLSYYNISFQPKPEGVPGNPPPSGAYGYNVTRSFAVKVRAVAKAGGIVDAISASSGIEVNGVTFGIANPAPARSQATTRAVADARAKAEELAKAAGLRITGIKRIDLGGDGGVRPLPMMRAEAMTAKVPTTFDPGNVNVTTDVSVVFTAAP